MENKIVDLKNMDSVFAQATEDDLDFETIFEGDIDDQLVDIVEGLTDEGEFILDEAVEFDLMHNEDSDSPIKNMKKEFDNEDLFGAKDVEGTDKVKFESEPEKTTGESDADKVLDIDKLDQEYQDGKTDGKAPSGEEVTPEIEKEVKESTEEESMNKPVTDNIGDGTGSVEVKDEAPGIDADLTPDCDCKGECDKDIDPVTAPSDNGKDDAPVVKPEDPKEEKVDNKDLSPDEDDKHTDSNDASIKESIEECGSDPQCCDNKPSNEELLAQLAANLGYKIVKDEVPTATPATDAPAEEGCCKEAEDEMNQDLGDDSNVPTDVGPEEESCKEATEEDGDDDFDDIDIIDAAGEINPEDELADDVDDAIIADAENELEGMDDEEDDDVDLSYDPTDEDLIDAAIGTGEI